MEVCRRPNSSSTKSKSGASLDQFSNILVGSAMKHVVILTLAVLGLISVGCTDDVVIPEPNFVIESGLTNPNLVGVRKPSDKINNGETVVGLSVRRVRVLVSRIILHSEVDSAGKDDRTVKSGPFIYEADSLGSRVVSSVNVTPGTYDRLKFEIHRFSSSETAAFQNDATFKDFVTGDRYSVIIEGYVIRKTGAAPFSYRSDVTENLKLEYSPALVVGEGAITTSTLKFDVASAFKDGASILDPDDPKNESFIDNAIKRAFRANR